MHEHPNFCIEPSGSPLRTPLAVPQSPAHGPGRAMLRSGTVTIVLPVGMCVPMCVYKSRFMARDRFSADKGCMSRAQTDPPETPVRLQLLACLGVQTHSSLRVMWCNRNTMCSCDNLQAYSR